MRIGVDVDLTVVDTGKSWYEFVSGISGLVLPSYEEQLAITPIMSYNMADLFHDVDIETCLDFWRSESVYDQLKPLPNAVDVLLDLKLNKKAEIVFVSTIKGNHHKSKYYFLKKYFPFMDGFIATKEKKYAKVDMLIDDRLNVLENIDKGVVKIQKETPYSQITDFKPDYSFNDWSEFQKLAYRNF